MEKKIELKFQHPGPVTTKPIIRAIVRVRKAGLGYQATIRFPYAYMEPMFNNFVIDQLSATSMEYALELAVIYFQEKYHFLNKAPRQLHAFNFFLHRARFQKLAYRTFEGERFTFLTDDQVYAISENIDGKKFFKSKFQRRSDVTTKETLLLINYEQIFKPMKAAGFTYKLIDRILNKYDTTKLSSLKLFDDPVRYVISPTVVKPDYIREPGRKLILQNMIWVHRVINRLPNRPHIP